MKREYRESRFELLRIVAMFLIVLSHCIYFGVMRANQSDAYEIWIHGSALYKFFSSCSILGTIGVGIFFMISGFFTAHKERTSIKKVCVIVLFYAVLVIFIIGLQKWMCVGGYSTL